jgi:hypothetical protein
MTTSLYIFGAHPARGLHEYAKKDCLDHYGHLNFKLRGSDDMSYNCLGFTLGVREKEMSEEAFSSRESCIQYSYDPLFPDLTNPLLKEWETASQSASS